MARDLDREIGFVLGQLRQAHGLLRFHQEAAADPKVSLDEFEADLQGRLELVEEILRLRSELRRLRAMKSQLLRGQLNS